MLSKTLNKSITNIKSNVKNILKGEFEISTITYIFLISSIIYCLYDVSLIIFDKLNGNQINTDNFIDFMGFIFLPSSLLLPSITMLFHNITIEKEKQEQIKRNIEDLLEQLK